MKPVLYGMSAMFFISLFALFVLGSFSETSGERSVSPNGTVRLD